MIIANYNSVLRDNHQFFIKNAYFEIVLTQICQIMQLFAKDFVPQKSKGGMFKSGTIQGFQEVLDEANQWIKDNGNLSVINVETIVLPNIHDNDEEGSMDTELYTAGESASHWYQLLRVWYKE